MDAGKLDRRIEIQALTTTTDDYGGVVETWAELAKVWARFLPGAGNAKFTAAQVHEEAQARFHIRWRSDVSAQNRILFDGKVWEIIGDPVEIGRRDGLEIFAKAVV